MLQWFGVSANAFLNTRWTQFINDANYKVIDSNMMDCANVTKIPTPPSAKRYLPLTSLRCTKTISWPGMASYRTSLLTSHSVMEMCFSCFMNTKYKCLRCKLPICNKCSVLEENEDVEGWKASKKRKAGRALYFGISLTHSRIEWIAQGHVLITLFYEVQHVKWDRRRFDVCYHAGIKSTLCRTYF